MVLHILNQGEQFMFKVGLEEGWAWDVPLNSVTLPCLSQICNLCINISVLVWVPIKLKKSCLIVWETGVRNANDKFCLTCCLPVSLVDSPKQQDLIFNYVFLVGGEIYEPRQMRIYPSLSVEPVRLRTALPSRLPAYRIIIFRHTALSHCSIMPPEKAGSHDALQFSKSGCDLKEESRKNKQTFGFSPVFRINSICLRVARAFQPLQLFATL